MACADNGYSEIKILALQRHFRPFNQRKRSVIFQKHDTFIGNGFCTRLIFRMFSVGAARRGGFDFESSIDKFTAAFRLVSLEFYRIRLAELRGSLPHG